MKLAFTLVGAAFVLTSFYDQFETLFHPAGYGTMSDWTARLVWKLYQQRASKNPHILTLAGPTAMLLIIMLWAALIVFGWAFFYYFRLAGFGPAQGLSAAPETFANAVAISLNSLVTMQVGWTPRNNELRFAMGCEAVVGIALLTASVSWLLSVYPILEGRSSSAQGAISLQSAEAKTGSGLLDLPDSESVPILFRLAEELTVLRNQTVQFPVTYFFGVRNPHASMALALPYIRSLCKSAGEENRSPAVRFAAHLLHNAFSSYLHLIAEHFLRMPAADGDEVLRRYAADNFVELTGRRPADTVDVEARLRRIALGESATDYKER